jgi:uncharacterized protein YjbJ (UPF0337 family)
VARSRFLFRQQFLKTWIVADRMKGKLKQKYGQLMDNNLSFAEKKEDELPNRLQQRLGKSALRLRNCSRDRLFRFWWLQV